MVLQRVVANETFRNTNTQSSFFDVVSNHTLARAIDREALGYPGLTDLITVRIFYSENSALLPGF